MSARLPDGTHASSRPKPRSTHRDQRRRERKDRQEHHAYNDERTWRGLDQHDRQLREHEEDAGKPGTLAA